MAGGRPKIELENIDVDGWTLLDALVLWADSEMCAKELGISTDTLTARIKEKYNCSFPEYRDKRRAPMKVNLFKKQYDVAIGGNVTMLIFLGKNYLGQSDTPKITAPSDGDVPSFRIVKYEPAE